MHLFVFLLFFFRKKKEEIILTDEFKYIINVLENSNSNVFISGKAGTGKSTLLKYFCKRTSKHYVLLAPTGVAALNIKGQTIHSFFKFPPKLLNKSDIKVDYVKDSLFKNIQMVIIDEVSMVSSNLMDSIDYALRINRNKEDLPFGGVQIVFIGDLFQLPPVVKEAEQQYFQDKYGGIYF